MSTKGILTVTLSLGLIATAAKAEVVMQRLEVSPWTVAELGSAMQPGPGSAGALVPASHGGEHQYLILYTTSPNAAATTTLFAIVNCNSEPVDVEVGYFDDSLSSRHQEMQTIPANGVRTVNLRDKIPQGISLEGVVRIVSSLKVLVDDFQVETGARRASGGRALAYGSSPDSDVGPTLVARAFQGTAAGLGTVFRLFLTAPQGDRPGIDPPSLVLFVHDQDGGFVGGVLLLAAKHVVTLDFADVAAALGYTGTDAKVILAGNSAAVAAELGIEPPSEDVEAGGRSTHNAGDEFNVGDQVEKFSPLFVET